MDKLDVLKDQNTIVSSESINYIFVDGGDCSNCAFKNTKQCHIDAIPCFTEHRNDKRDGNFKLVKK